MQQATQDPHFCHAMSSIYLEHILYIENNNISGDYVLFTTPVSDHLAHQLRSIHFWFGALFRCIRAHEHSDWACHCPCYWNSLLFTVCKKNYQIAIATKTSRYESVTTNGNTLSWQCYIFGCSLKQWFSSIIEFNEFNLHLINY